MFAAVAALLIVLSLPLTFYNAFLPQTMQQDTKTTITAETDEIPCITPEADGNNPPSDDNDTSDGDQRGNNNNNQDSDNDDESGQQDNEGDNDQESDTDEDQDENTEEKTPKATKVPKQKTPKNLAKKIQKQVKRSLKNKNTTATPTPNRPLIQLPEFPEGFPFNNKKSPLPTEKPRPTSPVKKTVIKNPANIEKAPTKAKKGPNVPNAKEIQKSVKKKLKDNKVRVLQTNPCVVLDFKVQIHTNLGSTSKLVPGATVRILQDGELIEELTADEEGWVYTTLPAGTYQVEVLDPDYKPLVEEVLVEEGERVTNDGHHITLEPQKQQSSNQNPDTEAFSVVISAYVTDSPTSSVKGTVLIISQSGANLQSCTIEATSCSFSLPKGNYTVTASNPNYQQGTADFAVVGTTGKEKNPQNYYETVAVSMNPYTAENPKPDQPFGAQSEAVAIQYNTILECFGQDKTAKKCTKKQRGLADLNKDGKIDQKDYNIFLYELRIQ